MYIERNKDTDKFVIRYLRALAAFYIRLTYPAVEVYKLLEPLLADYHKLRIRNMNGFRLTYMDEFIDSLLNEERACDIALPRLPKRTVLEDLEELDPRESALGSELDDSDDEDDEGAKSDEEKGDKEKSDEENSEYGNGKSE